MPDTGGLQLLPETRKKIEVKTPGENRLLTAGIFVFVIVAVLIGVLYFYQSSLEDKLANLDVEILALEQQRNKQAEENILVFNKQLSMLSNLLNSHTHWSTAFSKIESLAQNQVQFNTMTTSLSENKIDFKAAAANYTTIARQIAAFISDDSIKDVQLNKINTLTNGQLEFSVQLTFDRSKFLESK